MKPFPHPNAAPRAESSRLDHLDATRAFALVLGVVFHASLSFMPTFMGWAVQDVSTSPLIAIFVTVAHSFRMETFFLLAGFFGCVTLARKGLGEFVRSRALRLGVPFVAGWFLLRPLLVSGWIMGSASLRGDYSFWAGIRGGFQTLRDLPAGIFTGTHLWFLYYLALITAVAVVARALLPRTGAPGRALAGGADALVRRLADSRLGWLAFTLPTAGLLWFMRYWAVDTPDQTLLPNLPVLLLYGGCFALGWLIGRQPAVLDRFARLSFGRCVLAAVGMVGAVQLSRIERDYAYAHRDLAHVAFVASYALAMWSLVFLTIGVFKKICAQPRGWVRYVADSSYWMYLIHLPIVAWLQVAIATAPLHWSVKLAFVSAATVAIALVSYDLLVRSTFIGRVLNGRRRPSVVGELVAHRLRKPPGQKQVSGLMKSGFAPAAVTRLIGAGYTGVIGPVRSSWRRVRSRPSSTTTPCNEEIKAASLQLQTISPAGLNSSS